MPKLDEDTPLLGFKDKVAARTRTFFSSLVLIAVLILGGASNAAGIFAKQEPAIRRAERLRVFILAGQSNMQGHGLVDRTSLDGFHEEPPPKRTAADGYLNGTLEYLVTDPRTSAEFSKLKTSSGAWVERADVLIWYNDTQSPDSGHDPGGSWSGLLSPGFGGNHGKDAAAGSIEMGPEMGIGWTLGDHYEDPVLLIKTAWGGKSLCTGFRPPSSGGEIGPFYTRMVEEIRQALNNIHEIFPSAPRRHKLEGFLWHQGWSDAIGERPEEYGSDLANLIRDVRKDLGASALPWTVGVSGMGGYRPYTDTQCTGALDVLTDTIIPAQFSVANASLHPDLAGTVSAVETRAFHREARFSPGDQCYHWNNNCESYWRVGVAMGESMLELKSSNF